MVDANGGYRVKQAVQVGRRLADLGVEWFEEPVSSDDLSGLRLLRDRLDLEVAAGEYAHDAAYVRRLCAAGAVDCVQVDATRAGGVTGWLRAAAVADAFGLAVSAHCAPQLHLPLAQATPNLRHVEWFHDHVRVERLAFDGFRPVEGGRLRSDPSSPGHGLELRCTDLEPHRVA
jgi:L-alanine-DL-glutamate epimerase-like enolase superfamily enzyme